MATNPPLANELDCDALYHHQPLIVHGDQRLKKPKKLGAQGPPCLYVKTVQKARQESAKGTKNACTNIAEGLGPMCKNKNN